MNKIAIGPVKIFGNFAPQFSGQYLGKPEHILAMLQKYRIPTTTQQVHDMMDRGVILLDNSADKLVETHELVHRLRDQLGAWSAKQYGWNPVARIVEETAANRRALQEIAPMGAAKRHPFKYLYLTNVPPALTALGQEIKQHPVSSSLIAAGLIGGGLAVGSMLSKGKRHVKSADVNDRIYTKELLDKYKDPRISDKDYLAALKSSAQSAFKKDIQDYKMNESRVSNKELETSKEFRSNVVAHAAAGGLLGTLAGGTIGGLAKIVTLPTKSAKGLPLVSAGVVAGGALGALSVGGYRALKGRQPVQSYPKPDRHDYTVTGYETEGRQLFTKKAAVVENTLQEQEANNEGWRKWFFSMNRQDDSPRMKHPVSNESVLRKVALNMNLSKLKPLLKKINDENIPIQRVAKSVTTADYRTTILGRADMFDNLHDVTGIQDPIIRHFKASKGVNKWLNNKVTTAKTTVPVGAVVGAVSGNASTKDEENRTKNTVVGAAAGAAVGASVLNSKIHRTFTNLFKNHPDIVGGTLAHEFGHHLQHKDIIGTNIQRDASTPFARYLKESNGIFGSLLNPSKIEHERDASQRGAKVLSELKIPVSKKRINRDLSYALNTYKGSEHVPMGKEDFFKQSSKQVLKGGLADKKSDKDFDPKALKAGMKVESEHTSNPKMQKEIAEDHLTEDKHYYAKLKKMEKK